MTAELLVTPAREPSSGSAFDHLRQLAQAAVGHPGRHCWRLAPLDGGVQVLTAGPGVSGMSDAGARTVRLVAGAAVANLSLGIAMGGRRPVVTLLPPSRRATVLAFLRNGPAAEPTPMERALAATAMQPTHHWLPPVTDRPVAPGLVLRARAAVEAEGLWLRTVDPETRARLAQADPRIAALPAGARIMALGSNHDVPAEHLRAGCALQRLVLTVQLLNGAIALLAWPADLASTLRAAQTLRPGDGVGSRTHMLVAVSAVGPTPWSLQA